MDVLLIAIAVLFGLVAVGAVIALWALATLGAS
jgi:hypothetical protein